MALQIFWVVAAITCVAAFVFAVRVRVARHAVRHEEHERLRAGQEKDDWLVCAVVWINVLCEQTQARAIVAGVGGVVLCWLAVRTFARLRRLARAPAQLS